METTKDLTAKASIQINTALSSVWEALTSPELISKYFFGTQTVSNWKVGSPITFRGEWQGKSYEDKGKILAYEPNKLLRYTYWSSMSGTPDKPENYDTVSYMLSEHNGQTVLSITQDGIDTEERKAHSEQNWAMVLTTMKNLLENNG